MGATAAKNQSWMKWSDFQGPTQTEEREAINRHTELGKKFRKGQRNVLRDVSAPDAAGQWGVSKHRGAGRGWSG